MPQDPESPDEEETKEKRSTSQGKSNSKKETSKRDGKEKKDRGVTKVRQFVVTSSSHSYMGNMAIMNREGLGVRCKVTVNIL